MPAIIGPCIRPRPRDRAVAAVTAVIPALLVALLVGISSGQGLNWGQPPSAEPPNVRPSALLAPVGPVEVHVPVTPTLEVSNLSDETTADSVHVTFQIRDLGNALVYSDQAYILNMLPASVETLEFTTWVPTSLESLNVITWTYWQGDSVPQDDTLRSGFRMRVRDVAVAQILAPPGVADSGVYYWPSCRVTNRGTQSETFTVNFRIGSDYSNVVTVANLPPLYSRVVTAADSWQAMPGQWLYTITLDPIVGLHCWNKVWTDTILVRGNIRPDPAVEILTPAGVYDTTDTIWPSARVANYGGGSVVGRVHLRCLAPGDTCVYHESLDVNLQGGAVIVVNFPGARFTTLGDHVARCSLAIAPLEPVVDTSVFTMVPGTGLAGEQSLPSAFRLGSPMPNPSCGPVRVRYELPRAMRADLAVYSADGRRVRTLASGLQPAGYHDAAWNGAAENGLRAGRGVYCVRLVAGDYVGVSKLVLEDGP